MKFRIGEEFKTPLEAFNRLKYGDKIKVKGGRRMGVLISRNLVIQGEEEKVNCSFNVKLDGTFGWTLKWNEIVKL